MSNSDPFVKTRFDHPLGLADTNSLILDPAADTATRSPTLSSSKSTKPRERWVRPALKRLRRKPSSTLRLWL
jgi:hypothetical protein